MLRIVQKGFPVGPGFTKVIMSANSTVYKFSTLIVIILGTE